jgi:hypothetical protein
MLSSSFSKFIIIATLGLLLGCSQPPATTATGEPLPTETSTNAPPQPDATLVAEPTDAAAGLALPTTGVINLAVPDIAIQTHNALWDAERPERDYFELAVQLLGADPATFVTELPDPDNLQLNDRTNMFIKTGGNDYSPVPVRVRYLSNDIVIWTGVNARATEEEIQAAAENFETQIIPINRLIFGREAFPGVDGDRRIHVVFVENPNWPFFGYFSVLNQYPTAIQESSNQREMFVMNLGGVRTDSLAFAGEMAHEYQHLIHWNKDPNEDHWLNEAMGELAIFLSGAGPASSAVGLTNAELFAENPDIQLTSRPEQFFGEEDPAIFAHYAAERSFAVYLLEQFEPQFIKDIVNNPNPGVISIQEELAELDENLRFEDVFANWLIAKLLNQPDLSDGQYGFKEFQTYLPFRELVNSFRGEIVSDSLAPYGARYYEVRSDSDVTVSFSGSTLARLSPVDPPQGQFVWYSNRGDESDFSLTRSFDLGAVSRATLSFDVWYELDEFYDYGYVELSIDDGQSWILLQTEHGTDRDPWGRSYGWGYTGASLDWRHEQIDLSAYTGQSVLIRFQVLTDLTANRDGVQLDNIEIPEIGYFDGAEDDNGGWDAAGFVRSSNLVPSEWIIWLVELSSPTRVSRIPLDELQRAEFSISGFGDEFPFAAIVVAPTALTTTEELDYELIFEQP